MPVLALDFETYYSPDYTLSKMTAEEYVRDERFEAHCVSIYDGARMRSARGTDIPALLSEYDWPTITLIAHNAAFDGFILTDRYGCYPAHYLCTMGAARYVWGSHVKVSLESCLARLGMAPKSVPYSSMIGKRWADMHGALQDLIVAGCEQDTRQTWALAGRLVPQVPDLELSMIDMTAKLFTEPRLEGDTDVLQALALQARRDRADARARLGVPEGKPLSQAQFVAKLEELGIEPEYKQGKTGLISATAKKDEFMLRLLDGSFGEDAELLAEAFCAARSSIQETRADRYLGMARRGPLPVALTYRGAVSGRWTGKGGRTNFQNLPRNGDIRKSLRAPEGHVLIGADLSQIELVINAYLAGEGAVLDARRAKRDVYCETASAHYGRTIVKGGLERQTFKVVCLASQFGLGHKTLAVLLRIPADQAAPLTDSWRARNRRICASWRRAAYLIPVLAGLGKPEKFLGCTIEPGRVVLPSGNQMLYEVEWSDERKSWMRRKYAAQSFFTGCTLCENIVQGTARDVLAVAVKRVCRATGLYPVLTTHDDAVWCVPIARVPEVLAAVEAAFSTAPAWLPDCPIDSEVKAGTDYGLTGDLEFYIQQAAGLRELPEGVPP
jgi:hypothetical protein